MVTFNALPFVAPQLPMDLYKGLIHDDKRRRLILTITVTVQSIVLFFVSYHNSIQVVRLRSVCVSLSLLVALFSSFYYSTISLYVSVWCRTKESGGLSLIVLLFIYHRN